jgi:glutathione synthase/RimK-type ligase-like ATP-grasp enzyme
MMIYLDDDSAGAVLIQALRQAGHDVRTPAEAGLRGVHDALHLRQAIREGRCLLSRNYKDFEPMNFLVQESQGRHSGILMIRQDDPKKRNMKPHDMVRALRKLEAAGVPIMNEYIVLNHWQ